jgi:alkaline phosphatase
MNLLKYILLLMFVAALSLGGEAQRKKKKETKPLPKNVIFLIGDGMGLSQISAGLVYRGGDLNLSRFKRVGFIKTQSSDDFITDSAAGATAFSIGEKTFNGAIGVDTLKRSKKTILEIAEQNGYSTGLVATCAITHATPASFIAHQPKRSMQKEIAYDFTKTDVDVVIGGGQAYFNKRKNGVNLIDTLKSKGYLVVDSTVDFTGITAPKFYAFTNNYHVPSMKKGRGDFSEKASLKAIEVLSKNPKGFFLMIEGSQIDWGGHDNDADYIAREMVDFDITIGKVLDWAEKDGNTLVVITADHETGGFALNGGSTKNKTIKGKFTTDEHTATMVPVFAFGPGADEFTGMYENTEIFHKMMRFFDFKQK